MYHDIKGYECPQQICTNALGDTISTNTILKWNSYIYFSKGYVMGINIVWACVKCAWEIFYSAGMCSTTANAKTEFIVHLSEYGFQYIPCTRPPQLWHCKFPVDPCGHLFQSCLHTQSYRRSYPRPHTRSTSTLKQVNKMFGIFSMLLVVKITNRMSYGTMYLIMNKLDFLILKDIEI